MENTLRLVIVYHEMMEPGLVDTVKFFRRPAFGTNIFCTDCSTKLETLQDNYDLIYWTKCKKVVNRHKNAARNVAISGEDAWERFLVSSGMTP